MRIIKFLTLLFYFDLIVKILIYFISKSVVCLMVILLKFVLEWISRIRFLENLKVKIEIIFYHQSGVT